MDYFVKWEKISGVAIFWILGFIPKKKCNRGDFLLLRFFLQSQKRVLADMFCHSRKVGKAIYYNPSKGVVRLTDPLV